MECQKPVNIMRFRDTEIVLHSTPRTSKVSCPWCNSANFFPTPRTRETGIDSLSVSLFHWFELWLFPYAAVDEEINCSWRRKIQKCEVIMWDLEICLPERHQVLLPYPPGRQCSLAAISVPCTVYCIICKCDRDFRSQLHELILLAVKTSVWMQESGISYCRPARFNSWCWMCWPAEVPRFYVPLTTLPLSVLSFFRGKSW